MNNCRKHICIFEHNTLKLNEKYNDVIFDENLLSALQNYHGDKGVPYFNLINRGVKFNEYVGVIQIGKTIIEVLPKADKNTKNDYDRWKNILIKMLLKVGLFKKELTGTSSLKIKRNSILDLYFELFIKEAEEILRRGLIKKYRKKEENLFALKGKINISKNISKNFIHQERFFVNHTVYDYEHYIHEIIYKTILLLRDFNFNPSLSYRIEALFLKFPKMPDIKVNDEIFTRIVFNRKNHFYKTIIGISRLLLLHYHPDVNRGSNHVLSLMFNMNILWEKFVLISLRKYPEFTIVAQETKEFWESTKNKRRLRPDIVLSYKHKTYVLDTKWKSIEHTHVSNEDLKQMYVYFDYYNANKVALLYPSDEFVTYSGKYIENNKYQNSFNSSKECGAIFIAVDSNIVNWQSNICKAVISWINDAPMVIR